MSSNNENYNPNANPPNTIIIFDWDDTLFCTSHFNSMGILNHNAPLCEKEREKLKKLERRVYQILNLSLQKGITYIITNSDEGWVEYSSKLYFPSLLPLLQKIQVVSSRKLFQKIFPNDFYRWKMETFSKIVKKYDKNILMNIICVGDSIEEIDAGKKMAGYFEHCYVKTVKLNYKPKMKELISQLNLIIAQYDKIYNTKKNWTITVEKKAN